MDVTYDTMPPAGIIDPEELQRRRASMSLGTGMPPAPITAPQPQPAPASTSTMPPAPVTPTPRSAAFPASPASGSGLVKSYAPGSPEYSSAVKETETSTMPPAGVAPKPAAPAQPSMPPAGKARMAAPSEQPIAQGMPPAPVGKEMQRYQDLVNQGEPQLHGWKNVLDKIGSLFNGGQAIERLIGGTPQNYDKNLNQAAMRAAKEQSLTEGEQAVQGGPAKAALNQKNVESEIAARGDKDTAALAKQGLKRDEQGNVVADEASPVYKENQEKSRRADETEKSLNVYRQSQVELNAAKQEAERSKNDPNSPAYKQAQQKLAMAQQAHAVAAQNLGLHQAEFSNKLQEQELIKPSGQSQSRGSAAQSVLNLYDRPGKPGLESLVRANASEMGPLIGRVNRGEMAIGDLPKNVGELVTAMESFYALQPAVHGFKNVEFVKDFKTAMGYLERDPESFIAGMKGLRPTLESVRDEGKTSHKRVVEGRDTPAGGGAAKVWNPKTGKYE